MTSFTKSFIWRFILDIILLGFLVRILQSIVLGIMSRLIESTSAIFLISEAIIVSSLSMLFICLITSWNIKVIANKGCYDYPLDSDKWFRNFAIIIAAINLISTIVSFIQWKNNLTAQYSKLDEYASNAYLTERVEQTKQKLISLNTTLVICLVIENVIGIAILIILLPKIKQKYNEV